MTQEKGEGRPRVVVVGGGFGGLYAALSLGALPVELTVVDRRNHHLFQPLLYQVATAALSPADIAEPIRSILRHQGHTRVLLAEAQSVEVDRKVLVLDRGEIPYDFLVLACGATHAWMGHDSWADVAMGLKTLEDAVEMRRRILLAYEEAEQEEDPLKRRALLTFVVVGGGPTGVELAGALAEIARRTLARDFRAIHAGEARVILVEAGERLLVAMDPLLSEKARESLMGLGVEVRLRSPVTDMGEGWIRLGEEMLPTRTVLWAAGVRASPLGASLGVPLDRAGRVLVEADLSIPGHPEVFVLGDMGALKDSMGRWLPGVAPVAIQQGQHVARNLAALLRGKATTPFRYADKGNMATIGRSLAVGEIAGLRLSGILAWLAWSLVHIAWLVGFENRVLVMIQWMWAWLTFQRGARLITGPASLPGEGRKQE